MLALFGGWYLYRVIVQRAGGATGYHVYALFRDASGVVPHSRITMAGIPVGTVDSIRLQDGMARVNMVINRDVALYDDATASRRSSSLLGEFLIVLAPGTQGMRRVVDGDRVRVLQEGSSTDDILNNVQAITVRVRQIVDRVGDVIGTDEGRREMADTLRNLQEVSAEINRTVHANSETITHALRNIDAMIAQGRPDVRESLENIRSASERVDHILSRNQDGVNDAVDNAREAIRNANAASNDLREALQHVNSVAAGVDRGEGTVGRLVRDDTLINEVEGVAEGVNDVLGPLGRLQTIVGLRSEYNFVAGSLKSYIELRLQTREDRYLMFEIVDDTRGLIQRSSTVYHSTNPNDPPSWRVTQERTVDALRFSLQFARRLGPVTFRFGIRESSGGAGIDLHLFRDSLEIQSDLFDFSASTLPRLRFTAAYQVMRNAWLLGGVDDVLNGPRRDYYLGAMLRFNDEDMRAILLFAGGLVGSVAR